MPIGEVECEHSATFRSISSADVPPAPMSELIGQYRRALAVAEKRAADGVAKGAR